MAWEMACDPNTSFPSRNVACKGTSHIYPWYTDVLCPWFRPRQFEYHPVFENIMVVGTLKGEVFVADHESNRILALASSLAKVLLIYHLKYTDFVFKDSYDSILALSWLHHHNDKFIAGSGKGIFCTISPVF